MTTASQRFQALDVFRGMTLYFMIIVNTPGSGPFSYAPLKHAAWHGFTPTDLVFPSFMFAVGNAMSFVMAKWAGMTTPAVLAKIGKRTLLIFVLGYLMYWFPFVELDKQGHWILSPISHTRILGVLQRIALAYGTASLLIYFLKPRATVFICVAILLLYWGVMFWYGDPSDPLSMTGNAGIAFDPEGWLSTLPSIGNVVAGYVVGSFVQQKGKTYEGLAKLLLAGFGLLVIAYFWDLGFPINKKLWTSSFVLYTVGLDCIILGAVIYVIDFLGKTKWTYFFEVFGKNPLSIYLLSELGATMLYTLHAEPKVSVYNWIYIHIFQNAGAYFGSFLFAVTFMLLCWSVGYFMDKNKIYIRV